MEIIEKLIQSKTGDIETCEDSYFFDQNFVAVIDGATSVSGRYYDGKTQGQLATGTVKQAIGTLSGNEDFSEILEVINTYFETLYQYMGIAEEVKTTSYLRPSAAMILYSRQRSKIWIVGDCQCFFSGDIYQNIKHIDEVLAEARSVVVQAEIMKGKTVEEILEVGDFGFDLIKPLIQKQYNFQNADPNHPLSYGSVNGNPIPQELIKTIKVPENVTELSLATDGYPKIWGTLEETEAELARIIKEDPLCIYENMSTKGMVKGNVSFDDRTYIRIKL
ncbi:hypothetical protein V7147_10400 [Bacillus sp. JJ1521]|uniref:hypothetical protein n=1 Tax=Bacillus sp. JJ1521 TaxID=3122957 RepID=UPI002FFE2235